MPIERTDVGAWVVKANPQMWDVHGAISGGEALDGYRMYPTYRLKLIETGDPVLVWATQDRRRKLPAGFVGEAVVVDLPREGQGGGAHWKDMREQNKIRPYVGLTASVWWDVPVDADECKADPILVGLEVLLSPQISNPSYITPEQLAVLNQLRGR